MTRKNNTAAKQRIETLTAEAMEMYAKIYDTEARNVEFFKKQYNELVSKYNAATPEQRVLVAEGAARNSNLKDLYIRTLELAGATAEMVGNVLQAVRGSQPKNNITYLQYRMAGLGTSAAYEDMRGLDSLETETNSFINECDVPSYIRNLISNRRCGITNEVATNWFDMVHWTLIGYNMQESMVTLENFKLRRFGFIDRWIKTSEK